MPAMVRRHDPSIGRKVRPKDFKILRTSADAVKKQERKP
jgi:hypothetical protein